MIEKHIDDPLIGEDVRLFLNVLSTKKRIKVFSTWRYLGMRAWDLPLNDSQRRAYDYMLIALHNRLVYTQKGDGKSLRSDTNT